MVPLGGLRDETAKVEAFGEPSGVQPEGGNAPEESGRAPDARRVADLGSARWRVWLRSRAIVGRGVALSSGVDFATSLSASLAGSALAAGSTARDPGRFDCFMRVRSTSRIVS